MKETETFQWKFELFHFRTAVSSTQKSLMIPLYKSPYLSLTSELSMDPSWKHIGGFNKLVPIEQRIFVPDMR